MKEGIGGGERKIERGDGGTTKKRWKKRENESEMKDDNVKYVLDWRG